MKMNTRTLAFALALGVAGAANAQQLSFVLGYGDATTAALNGSSVGSAIAPGTKVKIGGIGSTSTFQVWVVSSAAANFTGGNMFVGFDMATASSTTGYANNAAAQTAGQSKKIRLSDAYSNFATGVAGVDGTNADAPVDLQQAVGGAAGAATFRASRGASGSTLRSIGLNFGFGFGTGFKVKMSGGQGLRLADFVVTNAAIAAGDTFGDDAGENGLSLNRDAASGVNGLNYMAGNYTAAPVSYDLQAVPEPGTILAISAGLAALARRRKK